MTDLMIFNINGEVIMHLVAPIPSTLDIKSLSPGNYLFSVKEKGTESRYSFKLMVTD